MKKIKISIIDDDVLFRQILENFLKKDDFIQIVESVGSISSYRWIETDIILLDLVLPDTDNIEETIQIVKNNSNAIICLLTGTQDAYEIATKYNINDYLTKEQMKDEYQFLSRKLYFIYQRQVITRNIEKKYVCLSNLIKKIAEMFTKITTLKFKKDEIYSALSDFLNELGENSTAKGIFLLLNKSNAQDNQECFLFDSWVNDKSYTFDEILLNKETLSPLFKYKKEFYQCIELPENNDFLGYLVVLYAKNPIQSERACFTSAAAVCMYFIQTMMIQGELLKIQKEHIKLIEKLKKI